MLTVYIGYDPDFINDFEVTRRSILENTNSEVNICRLSESVLRKSGTYWRAYMQAQNGQYIDAVDGTCFSSKFSFTRFLVPCAMGWTETPALFVDSDFLFYGDIAKVFEQHDPKYAVQVVKHGKYRTPTKKKGALKNEWYPFKNWSSLMLFNPSLCTNLTPEVVSTKPGSYLHQFKWTTEDKIGPLDNSWNVLYGNYMPELFPNAVHFTNGTPGTLDMPKTLDNHVKTWYSYLSQ